MEALILLLQRLTPDWLQLDAFIRVALEEGKKSFQKSGVQSTPTSAEDSKGSILLRLWAFLMTLVLLGFLISCIEQSAQFYQTMLDRQELEKLKEMHPPHLSSSETTMLRHKARIKNPEPPKKADGMPALRITGKDFFCVSTLVVDREREGRASALEPSEPQVVDQAIPKTE